MARTHAEIMNKLLPLNNKAPERFKVFYDKVYLLLCSIPEGGCIVITHYCSERSIELFYDIAELCIIEERCHKDFKEALLEFSEDLSVIRRSVPFRPTVTRPHFYSRR